MTRLGRDIGPTLSPVHPNEALAPVTVPAVSPPTDGAALARHRQQFPTLQHSRYFNFGGQGPMPQMALTAQTDAHQDMQVMGPFSNRTNLWLQQQGAAMRTQIARELGTTAATITLTENVSAGCNIALWGLPWQAGDHILMSDSEHPGIVAAVQEICRRFGVVASTCPLLATADGGDPVAVVASHLRPQTRLLVVSHVLWNTGQILPLADLVACCHQQPQPVLVLVDAAQSVGMMPLVLPELGVDFYAFTGHKWWCGPAGLGGLYVAAAARDQLAPTFVGWRSITMDSQGRPTGWQASGQRYEVATSSYALFAGLSQAMDYHSQWGTPQQRYERICALAHQLWERLNALPNLRCLRQQPPETGLVSFQVMAQDAPDVARQRQLVERLEAQGWLLRTLAFPACVRACVHYFTLESEIDGLVTTIEAELARA